jgi:hypothetical protein
VLCFYGSIRSLALLWKMILQDLVSDSIQNIYLWSWIGLYLFLWQKNVANIGCIYSYSFVELIGTIFCSEIWIKSFALDLAVFFSCFSCISDGSLSEGVRWLSALLS